MFKKLAYAGTCLGMIVAVGCGNGTPSGKPDFSTNLDGSPGDAGDMSANKMYAMATPHGIDTDMIGGSFAKGTAVQLTNLIVISPVSGFSAKSGADCRYEVWAQDPACSTPPCGIVLESNEITNPGGTGAFCSYTGADMTTLKGVNQGDKVTVSGVVDTFPSTATAPATGTVVQHSVTVDTITVVATGQTLPAATPVTDTNPSLFVPYSGTGWAMYEGMLIKLSPPSGKFTTTLDSFGGWDCAPGGAHYADTFTGLFRPDGAAANMWPPTGSQFSSIQGIVSLTFGGGILPDSNADFTP